MPTDEYGEPLEGFPLVVLETKKEAVGLAEGWLGKRECVESGGGAMVLAMPGHEVVFQMQSGPGDSFAWGSVN